MFWAINKTTKERINSIYLSENPSYQIPNEEEWIADPNEIENWDELKEKNINEIKVIFVKEKEYINYNGTQVFVSPHFRIPNKEKLGINTIPESKEHKLAKNWIYNRIKNDDLILIYSKINKPEKYENSLKLKELELDLNKIGIETSVISSNNRRADIIVPFLKRDDFWGNGIIFEIQFSPQYQETEEKRTLDWVLKGYSVIWLKYEDFKFLDENFIELKNNKIRIEPFAIILYYGTKDIVKNLKYEIQEQCRLLDKKKNQIFEELGILYTDIIHKASIDGKKEAKTLLIDYFFDSEFEKNLENCPDCLGILKIKRRRLDQKKFIGCSNYPNCRYMKPYPKRKNGES